MKKRDIPSIVHKNETKNKIMDVATKMFAERGYDSVALSDIADAVGIKIASIYNHYKVKQDIMDDILLRFETVYRDYIDWQSAQLASAKTLDEVMDILFNEEFIELQDPTTHFDISFVIKEQHKFESARELAFELFHEFTIDRLKEDLEKLIDKKILPPSDTEPIARMFMYHVLVGNDMRVHELSGIKLPVDCKEMYAKLKLIMRALLGRGY